MHGIEAIAQTLLVALYLLGALVAFGLARLFVLWMRGPVKSQSERESDFLVRQMAARIECGECGNRGAHSMLCSFRMRNAA